MELDSRFQSPIPCQQNTAQLKEGCMGQGSTALQTGLVASLSKRSLC
jgi:hypothetical protein